MGFGLYRKEMTITYFVKTLMELTFYVSPSLSEYVFEYRTNISLHELMNQNIKRLKNRSPKRNFLVQNPKEKTPVMRMTQMNSNIK